MHVREIDLRKLNRAGRIGLADPVNAGPNFQCSYITWVELSIYQIAV